MLCARLAPESVSSSSSPGSTLFSEAILVSPCFTWCEAVPNTEADFIFVPVELVEGGSGTLRP